ncbi:MULTISPECIES: S9 family peptidase [Halomicrobium]|uniref:Peptidase S9 prolyl oligopeptidase active site domain protein n=2 Tax=Halomicrobium mukohataei TaxID=57705 RepID=C7P2D1_HALMD|nr:MULTISPECIES: S9 family peptidase [Halomicrobium]ACV49246.1 peptidase S9 prolyl oligopeptidase active site domain protein [Halomicrobium mukohataei DSM 12286]QCD64648.1 S9 family peptidase [Halomicrobium mukohataei]QFR19455.1 prolyl oligopeptidase family serine peptidase [Halomicrobium sp. ZPS1]
MYDLERYLNVRSATGATLGPDGQLAFRMNATGTFQLWNVDEPGGWPQQRTFYEDSVSFASYSPERPELIFGKDEGGDERMQLFRLDADGTITSLTDSPDAKHRWGGWSHDGERFAFASNRRDESVFDIYVQGRDDDEATLVHEGDGWLTVGGWSPDDTKLLVGEAHSNVDQDLFVLDLESGDFEHLTPHHGDVRYGSAQWAPDGDGVYLVTDSDADLRWLARLDLDETLREVVSDDDWNVDGVSVDVDTGRLAYSRNVDGYTDLTVGRLTDETTIETFPTPELPGGIAGGVSWGPDAERFAVTVTGRTVNTNVFVVETETGEATRWTHASTAGIPDSTFVPPELVHFESFDGREIPAFFSLPPAEVRADDGVPVIVDIHGGPESQRRPSFSGLQQYFLSRGYALFEPNVRGSSGYGTDYMQLDDVENRLDSVRDIRAGVDWLHEHPAVDPDRLVAKGGSYGGFMVLAAMTEYPDLWAAGVDVVGIANFVTFLENTGDWRRSLREAEYGSLEDDRGFLESVSPIHSADQIAAPLFVIHGENDPRVPVGEAEQIADAVREQDVPVELLVFDDEGHGIAKRENRIEAYTRVVEFLDEHV